ncbi:hypothetical protein IQ266_20770 [filamentous cyanobacterium LEGE 11480]|uniref:Uncharacterized protein n=1 Tax=Romeriopsis navalis LEGE 11480 TaxID=2777977 RepID=A0A928Z441_9CYAN|nr:hypothetical protein [Romeriopsis navalis]MBE9032176.1 hypothetical protein [Romeriopsis navalis LEGE 11480]
MDKLFNYFWLLSLFTNFLNSAIFWGRAQSRIRQNPELRSGYIRLIRGFIVIMSIPWIIMGIGLETGQTDSLAAYFNPRSGNQAVLAWWISLWAVMGFYLYWIWYRNGAEKLVKHPGLLRGNPNDATVIRLGSTIAIILGFVIHLVLFQVPIKFGN